MGRRGASLIVGLALVFAPLFASSAEAGIATIGQLFTPTGACNSSTILQTEASGNSYVVPAPGVITDWFFQEGASTSPGLKFKVGRSQGGPFYAITAESAAGTQVTNSVNTYAVNIPVQTGDIIGLYGTTGFCGELTTDSANSVQAAMGDIAPGSTAVFATLPMGQISVEAVEVLQPGVGSVSPSTGRTAGGTEVVITGHDFTGATAVRFGGIPAKSFTVNSDRRITSISPAGSAGTRDVTVTTTGGRSPTSAADHFTYVSPPSVRSLTPANGPRTGGTKVAIVGNAFVAATTISFGRRSARSFTVVSNTEITAVAPAGTVGGVDVKVTTPFGQSPTTPRDRYTFNQVCVVPNLKGKTLNGAKKALLKAHCGVGKVTGPKTGKVKRQSRKPGLILPVGRKVNITLA